MANPSWCSTHKREVTQDHYRYYDDLLSQYGQRVIMDMCVCQSIHTFKDRHLRSILDEDYRNWHRIDELKLDMEREKKRKEEKELDKAGRWYFITFTRPDTEKDPSAVLNSTRRLLKSKQVSPIQWCYSLELTEKGTPHTHIRLFSNKYFDYKKVGNFNDGFRYDIQPERSSSAKYIIKEESKPPVDFLERYKLDRFVWQSDNYVQPADEVIRNEIIFN